jgi:hypothetical protein
MQEYYLPDFLNDIVSDKDYRNWLDKKSKAVHTRDKKRFKNVSTRKEYKKAIHGAIINSKGYDFYTNERLDWTLIGQYDNEASKKGGIVYKRKFHLLPTIEHFKVNSSELDFKICSWRSNDAKNDMTYDEFIRLCELVLKNKK